MSTIEFVLVHGSWHTGACWDEVKTILEAKGHRAFAPTLPGRGAGQSTDVTMRDYADSVAQFVAAEDLSGIVLVGHSAGGTVVCKAAEQLGERIDRLVLVSPLLADSGRALTDAVPPDYAGLFAHMASQSPDNTIMAPWEVWRDSFIGDAEEALARKAYEQLCAEPFGPLSEPVDLEAFAAMPIAKSYVNCTEDVVFPVGEYGLFPRMYQKVAPCRLVNAHGSHEMMYSNPQALADALVKAGRP